MNTSDKKYDYADPVVIYRVLIDRKVKCTQVYDNLALVMATVDFLFMFT